MYVGQSDVQYYSSITQQRRCVNEGTIQSRREGGDGRIEERRRRRRRLPGPTNVCERAAAHPQHFACRPISRKTAAAERLVIFPSPIFFFFSRQATASRTSSNVDPGNCRRGRGG